MQNQIIRIKGVVQVAVRQRSTAVFLFLAEFSMVVMFLHKVVCLSWRRIWDVTQQWNYEVLTCGGFV